MESREQSNRQLTRGLFLVPFKVLLHFFVFVFGVKILNLFYFIYNCLFRIAVELFDAGDVGWSYLMGHK